MPSDVVIVYPLGRDVKLFFDELCGRRPRGSYQGELQKAIRNSGRFIEIYETYAFEHSHTSDDKYITYICHYRRQSNPVIACRQSSYRQGQLVF